LPIVDDYWLQYSRFACILLALVAFAIATYKPNTKTLPKKSHNKKSSYLLILKIIEPGIHNEI